MRVSTIRVELRDKSKSYDNENLNSYNTVRLFLYKPCCFTCHMLLFQSPKLAECVPN